MNKLSRNNISEELKCECSPTESEDMNLSYSFRKCDGKYIIS